MTHTQQLPSTQPAADTADIVHLVTRNEMHGYPEVIATCRSFEGAQRAAAADTNRSPERALEWTRTEYADPERPPTPWTAPCPHEAGVTYMIQVCTLTD